jgi:hypothetical protein
VKVYSPLAAHLLPHLFIVSAIQNVIMKGCRLDKILDKLDSPVS